MIDPNVWVSAVINPYGTPARVAEAVARNVITAVVSQQLLDELAAVLIRPKFRKWISTRDAVAFVDSLGAHADLRESPEPSMTPIRDPNDAYLVALAEATGSLLVSGDEDLLAGHLDPPAISPAQLLNLLDVDGPVQN